MNRTIKNTMGGGVLALALGALPTTLALAAHLAPEEQAFKGHKEISDMTLGGVRGSFISANQILFFGVEMYTEWYDAKGQLVASSALNIDIDRNNGHPTVSVTSNVQAPNVGKGNGSSASSGQISSGGLNQVQGVSQVVQSTGNRNGVANAIGIDVGTQRPTTSALANTGGNNTITNQQTGVTAQTYVRPNSAGVIVTVPTQGTASQSVASMVGAQQRAQVYGDANNVHNQLNMVIQVQPNSTTNGLNMSDLLQTVRGR